MLKAINNENTKNHFIFCLILSGILKGFFHSQILLTLLTLNQCKHLLPIFQPEFFRRMNNKRRVYLSLSNSLRYFHFVFCLYVVNHSDSHKLHGIQTDHCNQQNSYRVCLNFNMFQRFV